MTANDNAHNKINPYKLSALYMNIVLYSKDLNLPLQGPVHTVFVSVEDK